MARLPLLELEVCRSSFPKFRNQYASLEPTYSGSANRSYAGRSEVVHCDVEISTSTKYVQSGAPVLWSFVRLLDLVMFEAPHRRGGQLKSIKLGDVVPALTFLNQMQPAITSFNCKDACKPYLFQCIFGSRVQRICLWPSFCSDSCEPF